MNLSKLVEAYLDSISGKEEKEKNLTPLIERLSGVIELPDNFDYKKGRAVDLEKKQS